jgi:methylthioribose-1-phosphate isomerase
VAEAIRRLAIRGAPLIGVAAAYGVALELARAPTADSLERACDVLRNARPTAVNLAAAVDRVQAAVQAAVQSAPIGDPAATALREARAIHAEEEAASAAIATHGAELLAGARRILTHCNTGALAAPGRGTALAVIAELAERGSLEKVIATESRPLLQGARLTVYELAKLHIPHELIVDSAAAGLIAGGAIDAVIVGCDRVTANGDVANKVGTYGLALAARAAGVPFVVAGPTSTVDPATPSGAHIVIEERDAREVREAAGRVLTLDATACRNPAFDVTPAALVSALVTERGTVRAPDAASLAALTAQSP